MQVTQTIQSPAAASAKSGSTAAQSSTLDYNSFLTLLITQMKNQDPLNPQDPTQYVSQLASFSSVEQQINTNSKLDSLLAGSSIAQAEGMIGRTMTSADGAISGTVGSVRIAAAGTVATLTDGRQITIGDGVSVSA
jgi:flagellar basal-body rod modification protein FlgD